MSTLTHLECPECGRTFEADKPQTFCSHCKSPLLARYDLAAASRTLTPDALAKRPPGLWRWHEILPVRDPAFRFTLGEGDTPLLPVPRLAKRLGMANLWVKDESQNPTGTFKARGLVMAVSRAVELGLKAFVIPTAGNAGGALAAYAARARAEAHVFMPADAPQVNKVEVEAAGAHLVLVDGLISDAAKRAEKEAKKHGWWNVSTFKEPYRLEGKKVMGLEVAEAFGWDLPDVIVYPTGGGTGLVGMWKAFDELEALGWIGERRPRLVSVQAEGCAPIVRAFQGGEARARPWKHAHTIAAGLRVPSVFADRLILRALRATQGTAVAVPDAAILQAQHLLATMEGVFAAPEGAATLAGLQKLLAEGWIRPHERVVLFNTGSGLKYVS